MRIGIDTSGKFTTDLAKFEPTVVGAAVGPDTAFDEIASWTRSALRRWGYPDTVRELHAKQLRLSQTREVCEMVAGLGDVRLAAVVSDPGMLRSPEAIARHRRRQRTKAAEMPVTAEQGRQLKAEILKQLGSRSLRDHEYVLSACLPMVLTAAAQKAIAYFAEDASRADMDRFVVRIDQESAPTARYGAGALFPSISGDERFVLRTPAHWAEDPVHPLLARIHDPADGKLWLLKLFDDLAWVDSARHPEVQIADVAAWVLARRIKNPWEEEAAACFEPLAPLLSGESGLNFEFFSIGPIRPDQEAMYAHLQHGTEPIWWLRPASPPMGAR